MPKLIMTPRAARAIERHHGFIADKNPEAARMAALTITNAVARLADMPRLGKAVEGTPNHRELITPFGKSAYISLYDYDAGKDAVTILNVRDAREDSYSDD